MNLGSSPNLVKLDKNWALDMENGDGRLCETARKSRVCF
jgi:hypothetical protein